MASYRHTEHRGLCVPGEADLHLFLLRCSRGQCAAGLMDKQAAAQFPLSPKLSSQWPRPGEYGSRPSAAARWRDAEDTNTFFFYFSFQCVCLEISHLSSSGAVQARLQRTVSVQTRTLSQLAYRGGPHLEPHAQARNRSRYQASFTLRLLPSRWSSVTCTRAYQKCTCALRFGTQTTIKPSRKVSELE